MKFLSQLTSATSGSVNGLTASHNRGGRYFRARVVPTDPATARQIQTRANLGSSAQQWALLSAAQRSNWNTYGANVTTTNALGESVTLSGQQWFIAAYSFWSDLADGGFAGTAPSNAPIAFNRGDVTPGATTLTLAAGLSVDAGGTWATLGTANDALGIYLGRPQNPTVSFFKGPWRRVAAVAGDGTIPSVTAYASLPYFPLTGQRVWVQLRGLTADGRVSPPIQVGPITVAAA